MRIDRWKDISKFRSWSVEFLLALVIIGLLVVIAFPVYSAVLQRTREQVGQTNARMLNTGIRALESFHGQKLSAEGEEDTADGQTSTGRYNHSVQAHRNVLLDFFELEEVEYVSWASDRRRYVPDSDGDGIKRIRLRDPG